MQYLTSRLSGDKSWVRLLGAFEDSTRLYMVMTLATGQPLLSLLKEREGALWKGRPTYEPLAEAEAAWVTLRLAGLLQVRLTGEGETSAAGEPPNVWSSYRSFMYLLQALHSHGVLHRDVKPENLIVQTTEPQPCTPAEAEGSEVLASASPPAAGGQQEWRQGCGLMVRVGRGRGEKGQRGREGCNREEFLL